MLEADTFPDTPTDTLIATLPGATDEVVIVNTHTDGPNATEENGALGILALAQYFAKLPKSERRRTLVFPLTTGHFAGPWVPSIRGVIEKHPDLIKRAVAAITVEHLGCREWLDTAASADKALRYEPTGKNEWSVAITPDQAMGKALVTALQGSLDRAGSGEPGQRRLARRRQQPVARRHPDDRLHTAAELSARGTGGWLHREAEPGAAPQPDPGVREAAPRHRDDERGAAEGRLSAIREDDRVFADGDARDLAGRDFELRGGDHLVRALDAGNAAAHQLRGAQTGDHDELERIGAVRTLNHETFFFPAALVRWRLEQPAVLRKAGGLIIPRIYSVNRYFSSTHSATMPSRQVIFLPSS